MGNPHPIESESRHEGLRALLHWYVEMGVDAVVADEPQDAFAATIAATQTARETFRQEISASTSPERPTKKRNAQPVSVISAKENAVPADEAISAAQASAAGCDTIDALAAAVGAFDLCPLKTGARNTVFIDGAVDGDLLIIGEAPGRDEDRIGKPFVGRAGQLLDKMLAAIERSRETDTLISNVIFWRPPGNRTPTQTEVAMCRPFVDRLITLHRPKAILLAGGAPTQAMLGLTGIMRNRGKWQTIDSQAGAIPALPIFHPAFLLRQPGQKRLAWQDLLALQERLA